MNSSPQAVFSAWLVMIMTLEGFGVQRHLASLFFTKPIGDTSEGHGTSSKRLTAFGYEILMAHHLAVSSSSVLAGIDPQQWAAQDIVRLGRGKASLAKKGAVLCGHF